VFAYDVILFMILLFQIESSN